MSDESRRIEGNSKKHLNRMQPSHAAAGVRRAREVEARGRGAERHVNVILLFSTTTLMLM